MSTLISFGPKKTDSIKIFKSCERYIKKNYDKATFEKVKPFLSEGDSLRDQLISSQNTSYDQLNQAIQNCAKYYRFLKTLEPRIPIASTDLKFTWFDTVNRKKFPVLTYKLEKLCVLYNIAAASTGVMPDHSGSITDTIYM